MTRTPPPYCVRPGGDHCAAEIVHGDDPYANPRTVVATMGQDNDLGTDTEDAEFFAQAATLHNEFVALALLVRDYSKLNSSDAFHAMLDCATILLNKVGL